jgi:glycosyltransferase involved in cell wall biosynthesis
VVDHGTTGLLTPLGDVDRLAEALVLLASDPGRRKAMADAAQRKAQREFDQQRVIDITLAVYRARLAATSA